MCGICGIWGKRNENLVERMREKISHRGPDAKGLHKSRQVTLGHTRLAILDLNRGDQPIYNEDGKLAIVVNGEIYNYLRLYKDLSKRHYFSTKSDSEVILHLYEEKGIQCVRYLDGMFAFCITDGNSIFVARDYMGIKPLYYSIDQNDCFYFSSEIKSMNYIKNKIFEFPAGSWYHSLLGFKSYYNVPRRIPPRQNYQVYVNNLRRTLENSVLKRLRSDVPVGTFLSGGIDSSIIAALAKRHHDNLQTFCVGVKESNDIKNARKVAGHIESNHHEHLFSPKEILENLPNIIYHLESYDQDLVRSAIPCYFVSKLASKYVKVILTGEGADELFGGYSYYKKISDQQILNKELRRSVTSLHNINLQRVDRMTMAHSIEGRVPFLDSNMIELALTIPTKWKLFGNYLIEKWILRKTFEDILPKDIVWRSKEQFDEGSKTVDVIEKSISQVMSQQEAQKYKQQHKGLNLRSVEECYYHKIFSEKFQNSELFIDCIGRWSQRPNYILR